MVGGFGLVGAPLTLIEALRGERARARADGHLQQPRRAGQGARRAAARRRRPRGRSAPTSRATPTSSPRTSAASSRSSCCRRARCRRRSARAARASAGSTRRPAVGTKLAEGREQREIDGARYLFCAPLRADVALIRARTADELGNLVYDKTARNFNPDMATAAKVVIAEVDEIVGVGELAPDAGRHAAPVRRPARARGGDAVSVRRAGDRARGSRDAAARRRGGQPRDRDPDARRRLHRGPRRSSCTPRTGCSASGRRPAATPSTSTSSTPASCPCPRRRARRTSPARSRSR